MPTKNRFQGVAKSILRAAGDGRTAASLAQSLEKAGVPDGAALASSLLEGLADTTLAPHMRSNLDLVLAAAFPLEALNALGRNLGPHAGLRGIPVAASRRLVRLAGGSPAVAKVLGSQEDNLKSFLAGGSAHLFLSSGDIAKVVSETLGDQSHPPKEQLVQQLRRAKYRVLSEITDFMLTEPEEIDCALRALSELAAQLLAAGLQGVQHLMNCDGQPPPQFTTLKGETIAVDVAVVGLGKLGGLELNYSSDVDLLFVLLADKGASAGWTTGEYFARLVQTFVDVMSTRTADGFGYRVDLRLRPMGSSGATAQSLSAMERYYQTQAMEWERLCLIKTRYMAGSRRLADAFRDLVTPFVYRRYLDYHSAEAMKALKEEINSKAHQHRDNIKEGVGGIREIEFFVQTMQVIYGGRDKSLQTNQTLAALEMLHRNGYIDAADSIALAEGYRLFRRVENALQLQEERQEHLLPQAGDNAGWRRLAAIVDPDAHAQTNKAAQTLRHRVDQARGQVNEIFTNLFYQKEASATARMPTERVLERVGEPLQRAVDRVLTESSRLDKEAGRLLDAMRPQLVAYADSTPDPVMALKHFGEFLTKLRHNEALIQQFSEKPATLKVLLGLFGTTDSLSRFLIRNEALLDSLLMYGDVVLRRQRGRAVDAALSVLAGWDDFEEKLDALRIFKNGEFVRIALNDLCGHFDLQQVSTELTLLAEACIHAGLSMVFHELGVVEIPLYTIVGLGKLGGGELGYGSDLDLLFVVADSEGRYRLEDGRQLSGVELMVKVVQRLVSVLQLATATGRLYRLDMRLRPSGSQGPLVTSLRAFQDYHSSKSQLWEHQALLRARRVAGDPQLWSGVRDTIVEQCVRQRPEQEVRDTILDMRMRLESELEPHPDRSAHIKAGWGGLLDIEFTVQALTLIHGAKQPELITPATLDGIARLEQCGRLESRHADLFREAYAFYRRIENHLFLLTGRPDSGLQENRDLLEKLAKSVNLGGQRDIMDGIGLLKYFKQLRSDMRSAMRAVMERRKR